MEKDGLDAAGQGGLSPGGPEMDQAGGLAGETLLLRTGVGIRPLRVSQAAAAESGCRGPPVQGRPSATVTRPLPRGMAQKLKRGVGLWPCTET